MCNCFVLCVICAVSVVFLFHGDTHCTMRIFSCHINVVCNESNFYVMIILSVLRLLFLGCHGDFICTVCCICHGKFICIVMK